MGDPVFDPSKPHGTIMHGDLSGQDPSQLPRFHQGGAYFRPDKSFHSRDGLPQRKEAAVKPNPASVNTLPAVKEEEVAALLEQPQAAELLELPRDHLISLVEAANGPVIQGDGSTRMMVAWLIKHTAPPDAL